jgi:hypothetical protein
MLCLPKAWSWLAIVIYLPLALWLVWSVTIRTIKKDWLYGALMALPIPVIFGWFLAVGKEGKLLEISLEQIHQFDPWIGLSFLTLGVTAAAFIRLRQRWLRVALLFVSGSFTLIMVVYYAGGRLTLPAFLILILVMLSFLISPVLLERKLRRRPL